MAESDRVKAAKEAANRWSSRIENQDPEMLRFARQCFATGYSTALVDMGLIGRIPGPLGGYEHGLVELDWPVAPC